ncbi:MAG: hypothetical protein JXR68_12200 [Bacteroidales bacterium]|nr:hypothetical protein [Bacteroidales bacterium]
MKTIYIALIIVLFAACKTTKTVENKDKQTNDTLIFVTSTPNVLNVPESVCYFPAEDVFFVSCINGKPSEMDENGYIAKIDSAGNIIKHKWVQGLSAPKGMAIFNDKLVVTDINKIVVIDIKNERIIESHIIDSAIFLNDVTVNAEGNFYISDMADNKIYDFQIGQEPKIFLQEELESPNGLFFENDMLYIGNKNYILQYDIKTKKTKIIAENTGSIDGLKRISTSEFIISDWSGNINIVSLKGEKILLLSTEKDGIT